MQLWQKIATSLWTCLLAAPVLLFLYAYLQLSCGEYDRCNTGGPMPYSGLALLLLVAVVVVQGLFLVMIWTRRTLDPDTACLTEAEQEQGDAGPNPA